MSRPGLVSRPSSVATLTKTIVLVSGGNAGIGLEIVKSLSQLPNHQVLMGCRDTHKGEIAAASIGAPLNVNPIQLDITDDESIEHAYMTIAQMFGKLDILINNAGTAGKDLGPDVSPRENGEHIFRTNVISTQLFTEKMLPVLERSKLPKIIFVSSNLGSIQHLLSGKGPLQPRLNFTLYATSKSALNLLAAIYATRFPQWKINAVCPGLLATGLNSVELSDETHPRHGAVRVVELAKEGPDGVTGTFSDSNGPLPW